MSIYTAAATALFVVASLLPNPVFAQDKIGTTTIDGKKVELFSDQTWSYEATDDASKTCETITKTISFCPSNSDWKRLLKHGPHVTARFVMDPTTHSVIIAEGIGRADGMSFEFFNNMVIEHFATGAAIAPADVTVFNQSDHDTHLGQARTLVYGGDMFGLSFVFKNTFLLGNHNSIQIVTYRIADEPSAEHDVIHEEFMRDLSIADTSIYGDADPYSPNAKDTVN